MFCAPILGCGVRTYIGIAGVVGKDACGSFCMCAEGNRFDAFSFKYELSKKGLYFQSPHSL